MRNRNDEYEPDIQIEFDEPIDSEEDADEYENPYEDYNWYELEVAETAVKIVRVLAKTKESAEEYLQDKLDEIDMDKDIDSYEKEIRLVEECEPVDCDYEVPKWWYEEEGEDDDNR